MEGFLNAKSELFDELHPVVDHELPPRPHTVMSGNLHSSSFRIVDHATTTATLRGGTNPFPVAPQHPVTSPEMKDQFLSPSKLREVSGVEDLSQITYIELSVNTSTTSVGNFGAYLPSLLQLCLLQSVVHSIRDLGTSLVSLQVLWMANCSLRDLDGLAALPSLQELYVANNKISDVSLISLLSELEVLDLESNLISDSDQLGYLCLCQNLAILNLSNNPIANTLTETTAGGPYRTTIRDTIPHLKVLDEIPFEGVDTGSLRSVSSYSLMSASMVSNWRDVNKGLLSPHSAQEKESVHRTVHKTSSRPSSAFVPGTLSPNVTSGSNRPAVTEDSSELTHGLNQVICGNPVRALRERQKRLLSSQSLVPMSSSVNTASSTNENTGEAELYRDNGSKNQTRRSKGSTTPQVPIPRPPPSAPVRPHTASDFRSRRYHRPAAIHTRRLTDDDQPNCGEDVRGGQGQGVGMSPHSFQSKKEEGSNKNKLLTASANPVRSRRVYRTPILPIHS